MVQSVSMSMGELPSWVGGWARLARGEARGGQDLAQTLCDGLHAVGLVIVDGKASIVG